MCNIEEFFFLCRIAINYIFNDASNERTSYKTTLFQSISHRNKQSPAVNCNKS